MTSTSNEEMLRTIKVIGNLMKAAIFHGRCSALEEIAATKEPIDLSKDPSTIVEDFLSKKPQSWKPPTPTKDASIMKPPSSASATTMEKLVSLSTTPEKPLLAAKASTSPAKELRLPCWHGFGPKGLRPLNDQGFGLYRLLGFSLHAAKGHDRPINRISIEGSELGGAITIGFNNDVYVDDIIFGSINKELLQQKEDGIFISQDKYVAEILKKFNYTDVKSASTPVDLEKPLVKDGDVDDVDVHLYRSIIG
ncbi:hypothetical protein Tco_1562445 [Tanacetum coccineum]